MAKSLRIDWMATLDHRDTNAATSIAHSASPKTLIRILQVSVADVAGGAERVAWTLFDAYRQRGHRSWLAVGYKRTQDPDVLVLDIAYDRGLWTSFWRSVCRLLNPHIGKIRGLGRLTGLLTALAEPARIWTRSRGREEFSFPGTWRILSLWQDQPDIVHCHNLHGAWLPEKGYFGLSVLPWLSRQVPVLLTLHDAWLLSGHCAHSFDCERWKIGCGKCPDLTIYPPVNRDATAYNWRRKRNILNQSRLYVSTPSCWLMQKVKQSILAPAMIEGRVIPNGVDLTVFHPGDQRTTRATVGIPQQAKVLLFVGNVARSNPWKDYNMLEAALAKVRTKGDLQLICLGEGGKERRIGEAHIYFEGYEREPGRMADYYRAADICVHAARADTFPNTVIEALACGTPVVATAVGGIPEQIEDGVTGFLVERGDAGQMATRIEQLLSDNDLRMQMGTQASEDAHERFDLNRQVDEYLEWYYRILANWQCKEGERPVS